MFFIGLCGMGCGMGWLLSHAEARRAQRVGGEGGCGGRFYLTQRRGERREVVFEILRFWSSRCFEMKRLSLRRRYVGE